MKKLKLKELLSSDSTIEDLASVMKEALGFINEPGKEVKGDPFSSSKKHYVYGIKGLAKLLGASSSTAQRIKSSGVLDAAISQNGKIIVIDADLALDLLRISNKNWGRKYFK